MAYIDQELLLNDSGFQIKVRQSMTTAALAVVGETPTAHAGADSKRHTLGVAILAKPDEYEMAFRRAVAANVAINASSSDSDVLFTVNSVFSDIAGVSGTDLA